MQTRSRLGLSVLSWCVAIAVLTACGGSSGSSTTSAAAKHIRIAYFAIATANTAAQAQLEGIKEVAAKNNASVDKVYDGNFNTDTQVAQIQDATTSGQFDAFLIFPNDGGALVPGIKTALGKGIKVGCLIIACGPDAAATKNQVSGLTITTTFDFGANGKLLADAIGTACAAKNPCKVAYEPGFSASVFETVRSNALHSELAAKYPNAKIVAEQDGQYSHDVGLKSMQNILQAHSDIDVAASSGDQSSIGIAKAVADAHLSHPVQIIGNGASVPGVQAVKDGTWFIDVVNLPKTGAIIAATAVINVAHGQPAGYPDWVNEVDHSPIGPFVTKDNASKFTAEWAG